MAFSSGVRQSSAGERRAVWKAECWVGAGEQREQREGWMQRLLQRSAGERLRPVEGQRGGEVPAKVAARATSTAAGGASAIDV